MTAAEFDSSVWTAACGGDINRLEEALTNHRHLVDAPNPVHWSRRTPMHQAAGQGDVQAIETLVRFGSKGIDTMDISSWTPLYYAAVNGHAHAVEALVRLGSMAIDTPEKSGWTPLYLATMSGNVGMIETLMRLGCKSAELHNAGMEPLRWAVDYGSGHSLRFLKAWRAPDVANPTPQTGHRTDGG